MFQVKVEWFQGKYILNKKNMMSVNQVQLRWTARKNSVVHDVQRPWSN